MDQFYLSSQQGKILMKYQALLDLTPADMNWKIIYKAFGKVRRRNETRNDQAGDKLEIGWT